MVIAVLFVIGAILGSFYLVIGTRLPKGEDVLFSRSHCNSCGKELKWYNLIPIFSYVFQRGKCTFCHQKISSEHFWVELATGILFVLTYLYFPLFSYDFWLGLIISSLLIIIFVSDFKYMIILDSPLIISSIITIALKLYYFDITSVLISIISGLALFLTMFLLFQLGKLLFKKEALGGGDIKLAFVIGLILNYKLGLTAIVLSSFIALPYALASLQIKKNNEFPYGPFLAGSLFIVFFHYDKFLLLLDFLFPF